MIIRKIKCDICGAVQNLDNTQGWYYVTTGSAKITIERQPSELATIHLCGEACVMTATSRWLANKSITNGNGGQKP